MTITVSSRDVELTLPAGTKLHVETGSGDLDVDVTSPDLYLRTGNGDIDVLQPAKKLTAETGSGDIKARLARLGESDKSRLVTGNGDVDVEVLGDPTVAAHTGNGDLSTTGFDKDDDDDSDSFAHTGSDGTVTVTSGNGDVSISRREDGAPLR